MPNPYHDTFGAVCLLAVAAAMTPDLHAQPVFSKAGDVQVRALNAASINASATVGGMTLSSIAALSAGAVPTSTIGAPNGIAGLDSSGGITAAELVNRVLQAPTLNAGNLSGTTIDAASLGGLPVQSYARAVTAAGPNVFLGGISNTTSMADPASMRDVLASGKIGLYIHPYAPNFTWGKATTQAITAQFNPLGMASMELGGSINLSGTEVTVTNKTSAAIPVPQETQFTDTNGKVWYSVLSGFNLPSGAAQQACTNPVTNVFQVPAGATCSLYVKAGVSGQVLVGSNQITSTSLTGLTVVSSLPITVANNDQAGYGHVGDATTPLQNTQNFISGGGNNYPFFSGLGINATIATVNVDNATSVTSYEVPMWKSSVDALRAGTKFSVIAPILQPSVWYSYNPNGADFATDPWMVNFRQQAIYGGGISFDSPPSYDMLHFPASYLRYIETMIAWARANNLEVIWIISPLKINNATTLADTVSLISRLKADNRLPTRWVIENYEFNSANFGNDCNAIGTANDTTKASVTTTCSSDQTAAGKTPITYSYANSLNNLALFLAEQVGTYPAPVTNAALTAPGTSTPMSTLSPGGHPASALRLSTGDLMDGSDILKSWMVGQPFGLVGYDSQNRAVSNGGLIVTANAAACNDANTAGNGNGAASSQGLTVCWNHIGGDGATAFINGNGAGSGGFKFYTAGPTGAILQAPATPLATLSSNGLSVPGGVATTGSVQLGNTSSTAFVSAYGDNSNSLNFTFWPNTTGSSPSGHVYFDAGGGLHLSGLYTGFESHISNNGSFTDPDPGAARDMKFGSAGIAVRGGTKTDTLNVTSTTQFGTTTLSGLPGSCTAGQMIYVSDARKSGEAAGSGSGVLALCTPSTKGGTAAWTALSTVSGALAN